MISPSRLILLISLFFVGLSLYYSYQLLQPPISPLSTSPAIVYPTSYPTNYTILGYLPYWNYKLVDSSNITKVNNLAYFSITLDETGQIINDLGLSRLSHPNITKAFDIARQNNILRTLTVTLFDSEKISAFLSNDEAINLSISEILKLIKQHDFSGINIDFEGKNNFSIDDQSKFSLFMQRLANSCRSQLADCTISVALYADTTSTGKLWDLDSLGFVNSFVVMAYDYHTKASSIAGPVSPLRGKCDSEYTNQCLSGDITYHLSQMLNKVPANKIILGIAFYGYEWQTVTDTAISNNIPNTGQTVQYRHVTDILFNPDISSTSMNFSNQFLTPFIQYTKDNKHYTIHYEDQHSIKLKTDFVKQLNLQGIALWALGYEYPFQSLWIPIDSLR